MKISACVITKNEEHNIARSIASYQDIVDEIIVVDSGSTDDTVKIAKSLGAKVYMRAWTDDFAAAKNYAIDRAAGDWIVFLDADEYFDDGGAKRAKELMQMAGQNKKIDSISVQMKHFADEQMNVLTVHPIVRIFKNHRKIRYDSKVHEYLQKEGERLFSLIVDEIILLHTGYIQETMSVKLERNLKLLTEMEVQPHMRCDIALSKAECYNGLNRHEEAFACIEEVIADENLEVLLRASEKAPDVYKFKAGAMISMRERFTDEQIEDCIREGMQRFPDHPDITQLMVQYLYETNRQVEAIPFMEKAIKQDILYRGHYINSFTGARDQKYVALGDLYTFYKNDSASARKNYEEALKIAKYNLSALNGLLWSMVETDVSVMIAALDQFYDRENSNDIRMIITAGLFCGVRDIFTTYFMYFANRWPEKIGADTRLINKVNLMKRDYQSLLEAEAPFWLIGEWAMRDDLVLCKRWKQLERDQQKTLILDTIAELVQTHDDSLLEKLLTKEHLCEDRDFAKEVARVFETMRRFELAKKYYGYAEMNVDAERMDFLMRDPV